MLTVEAAIRIQSLLESEAGELRAAARRAAAAPHAPSPGLLEHLYHQADLCQDAADEMGAAARDVAAAERRRLKVVCAWCPTPTVLQEGDPGAPVSHGICVPCALREFEAAALLPQEVARA